MHLLVFLLTLGRGTESQALSAQEMTILSSMGFQPASARDHAEATAAGISFLQVNSIAGAAAVLNQSQSAYSPIAQQTIAKASIGSYQTWESCTRNAWTWWVNAEARVTIKPKEVIRGTALSMKRD
ncbi:MAG: hypothetical protein OXE95_07710 [Chloroflexi bacterium]|nr:hypothetical protein [Chloroflexota bacterium]MCY4247443.1 hypothetical protein [Chloroflexota bacterium]